MSDAFWGMAGTVLVTLIGLATLFVQQHFAFKKASVERQNAIDDATADRTRKDEKLGHIEHLVNSEAERMRAEIRALKALVAETNGKAGGHHELPAQDAEAAHAAAADATRA